ncbi:MAG: hypothetical protein PHS54_01315 [Clostridia bacterium]|nr:hypothetical protein [Clostridia bacterium]
MRKRKIIKRGENSFAIALMKSDMDDFGLVEGDEVDIDDLNLIEQDTSEFNEEAKKNE